MKQGDVVKLRTEYCVAKLDTSVDEEGLCALR